MLVLVKFLSKVCSGIYSKIVFAENIDELDGEIDKIPNVKKVVEISEVNKVKSKKYREERKKQLY